MTNLFLLALAVAGIAIIWRTLAHDNPIVEAKIKAIFPKPIAKALLCGNCFTYWLSCFTVLVMNPLVDWTPPLRFVLPAFLIHLLSFTVAWFALACIAVTIRFASVAIQELVHSLTHDWRKHSH